MGGEGGQRFNGHDLRMMNPDCWDDAELIANPSMDPIRTLFHLALLCLGNVLAHETDEQL